MPGSLFLIHLVSLVKAIKPKINPQFKVEKLKNKKLNFYNFSTYCLIDKKNFVLQAKEKYEAKDEDLLKQIYIIGRLAYKRYLAINCFRNFLKMVCKKFCE